MNTLKRLPSAAYRFKPGRTFAQTLAAMLVGDGIGVLEVAWQQSASVAGLAGLVSLLQIWGEGGEMLAEDSRVTHTAERGYMGGVKEPGA